MTDTTLANVDGRRLEDARRVLRVLTAAFPTYPVGDDTAELYLALILKDMPDFGTAMRVAIDWTSTQLLFPKPVELVDAYLAETQRANRRAIARREQQRIKRGDSFACPRCEDSGVEVVKFVNLDQLYEGVVPCADCRPEDREYQRAGHLDRNHDVHACGHPRCEQRAERSTRRRGR